MPGRTLDGTGHLKHGHRRPAVTRRIYGAGVYRSRGQADTSNGADGIYRAAGERALCSLTRKGSGYTGAMTVGVAI